MSASAPGTAIAAVIESCRRELAHAADGDASRLAEQLAGAAETAGDDLVHEACLLLAEVVGDARADALAAPLVAWLDRAEAYLARRDATTGAALARLLGDECWPDPLCGDDVEMLASVLGAGAPELAGDTVDGGDDHSTCGSPCERLDVDDDGDDSPEVLAAPDAQPATDSADVASADHDEPAPVIPAGLAELIALLALELEHLDELADAALAASGEAARDAAEHVADQLECFRAAAEAAGLAGLDQACALLGASWAHAARAGRADERLRVTHGALARYVRAPFARNTAAALVAALRCGPDGDALGDDGALALTQCLCDADGVPDATEDEPARPTHASADQVTLDLPDDVPDELLETLLEELPLLTGQFSNAIERILDGGTLEDVNVAQRAAHTLKGAANTVGVKGIANLTHHVEDVLRTFHETENVPGPVVAAELVHVADCLDAMSEAIAGHAPGPADALGVLQGVLDRANWIDVNGIDAAGAMEPAPTPAPEQARQPHTAPQVEPPPDAPAGRDASVVRVPARLIDDYLRLTGETIILTGQVQERTQGTLRQTRSMQEQFALLQQLGYELEQLIDLGKIDVPGLPADNDPHFDPLELDEYSELHSLSRRMVEAATDAREMGRMVERQVNALLSMLADQGRLNRESHERVLETRMVPVKTIVPRLQRAVRQAARLTGKSVELEVTGADTRMDSDVLAETVDPLMHLLRNAVDHGIESTDTRHERAKPATGQIELAFSRAGNQVVVSCRDDGGGLDLDAIRAAAVARGRIASDHMLSDDALRRLILEPNFSTRDTATQVSGRGIGLDAVYGKAVELGGSLDLHSEPGAGCRVDISLPLTLISAHALLVRVQRHMFALSNRGIEQILHADTGTVQQVGDRTLYQIGRDVYPAVMLDSLLTLPADERSQERAARTAVLTHTEQGQVAVMVQTVIDSRDLVVKSLGRLVPKVRGIIGATILGDGAVTPVLDLPELLRMRSRGVDTVPVPAPAAGARVAVDTSPTALVVDDSLSARRALSRVMGDSGYRVRTARDGLEAVEILKGVSPDVLLVDLEMPRMNGLELVAHLRAHAEGPRVPVVMITSRSTAKHRDQARSAGVDVYLTKPFSEDQLLEHVESLRGGRS